MKDKYYLKNKPNKTQTIDFIIKAFKKKISYHHFFPNNQAYSFP